MAEFTNGSITVEYSDQYQCLSVIVRGPVPYDRVVEACRAQGAIYNDGEDDCFVVTLRNDIGPELWTQRSLRGSLEARS